MVSTSTSDAFPMTSTSDAVQLTSNDVTATFKFLVVEEEARMPTGDIVALVTTALIVLCLGLLTTGRMCFVYVERRRNSAIDQGSML